MKIIFLRLLSICILVSTSSCSVFRSFPHPEIQGRELSQREVKKLVSSLERKASKIQTYRSLAKVDVDADGAGIKSRIALVFEKPESIRAELLPAVGAFTLFLILHSNETYYWINPAKGSAVKGKGMRTLLRKKLGFSASADELISLLSGVVPLSSKRNEYRAFKNDISGETVIVLDGRSYWWIDSSTLSLLRGHIRSQFNDSLSYRVYYEAEKSVGKLLLPQRFRVEIPAHSVTANFRLSNISINKKIDPNLFSVKIPDNFEVKNLAEDKEM